MKLDTRSITGLAMVASVSYVVVMIMNAGGIQVVPGMPMGYEAKDAVLTIGGFIFGPIGALMATLIVSFVEMVTVSGTGPIGLIMNFAGSAVYVGAASLVYQKMRTAKGAVYALVVGSLSMTAIMLPLNYVFLPIYLGMPQPVVASLLLPMILPFNLIKSVLNSAFILLIYKPLVTALRKANIIAGRPAMDTGRPNGEASAGSSKFAFNRNLLLVAVAMLAAGVLAMFLLSYFSAG